MRCGSCGGSGRMMGGGMMMCKCSLCDGYGEIENDEPKAPPPLDKRSKEYKEAINKIMSSDPNVSRSEAAEIFEEEYYGRKSEKEALSA